MDKHTSNLYCAAIQISTLLQQTSGARCGYRVMDDEYNAAPPGGIISGQKGTVMNHPRIYPIVTRERQQEFEQAATLAGDPDTTPNICGIYGRACRQMNNPEGANRCLCHGCQLRAHCATVERSRA